MSFALFVSRDLDNLLTFNKYNVHSLSNLNSICTVEPGNKVSECFKMSACNSVNPIMKAIISRLGTEAWRVYELAKRKLHDDKKSALWTWQTTLRLY